MKKLMIVLCSLLITGQLIATHKSGLAKLTTQDCKFPYPEKFLDTVASDVSKLAIDFETARLGRDLHQFIVLWPEYRAGKLAINSSKGQILYGLVNCYLDSFFLGYMVAYNQKVRVDKELKEERAARQDDRETLQGTILALLEA